MKVLFFDSGPIISLVMSRLDWILPKLKEKFNGKFYITPAVRRELIERPMNIKRFEFEALQVLKMINDGVLEVYIDVPKVQVKSLTQLANSSFKIKNKTIDIMQEGEMESVVCALKLNAALVMDERTLRLYIERGSRMKNLLERRFRSNVVADMQKVKLFDKKLKGVSIIRSIELAGIAYKLGFLNDYIPKRKYGEKILVDAILWAVKYNGCAVTEHEIEEIKKYLLENK